MSCVAKQTPCVHLPLVGGIRFKSLPLDLGNGFAKDTHDVHDAAHQELRRGESGICGQLAAAGSRGGEGAGEDEGVDRMADGVEDGYDDGGLGGHLFLRNEQEPEILLQNRPNGHGQQHKPIGREPEGQGCWGRGRNGLEANALEERGSGGRGGEESMLQERVEGAQA